MCCELTFSLDLGISLTPSPRSELQHEATKKKFKATNRHDNLTGLDNGWEEKLKRRASGTPSLAASASDFDESMVQYGGVVEDGETDDVERVALGSHVKVSGKAKIGDNKRQFHVEYLIHIASSRDGTY